MSRQKCQLCENEATVHEVMVKNGVRMERHLCEACAQKHGLASQPINELISKYIISGAAPTPVKPAGPQPPETCPGCELTFNQFKQSGLLGCPECYRTFEALLTPLIERAHSGTSQHVGKQPRRMLATAAEGRLNPEAIVGTAEERARRLRAVRQQLDEAVQNEQYERAAKLRDELRRLQTGLGAPADPGGMPGQERRVEG
jgi:protein arginine kinase activator